LIPWNGRRVWRAPPLGGWGPVSIVLYRRGPPPVFSIEWHANGKRLEHHGDLEDCLACIAPGRLFASALEAFSGVASEHLAALADLVAEQAAADAIELMRSGGSFVDSVQLVYRRTAAWNRFKRKLRKKGIW
jgi:hypothetical protein